METEGEVERMAAGAEVRSRRVLEYLLERYGPVVLSGPFAGTRYVEQSAGSELVPKLLGTYEQELHPVVSAGVRRGYRRIVNVGCGEGYYAVGLARRLPGAEVWAYDPDPLAQRLCSHLAALNGVERRVRVQRECRPESLREALTPGSFLLCDCEGAEADLLQPERVPELAHCDLLVELHDFLRPGVTHLLRERFRSSHSCELVPAVERSPSLFDRVLDFRTAPRHPRDPWGPGAFSEEERRAALSECRPPGMRWAVLTSRSGPQPAASLSPSSQENPTHDH